MQFSDFLQLKVPKSKDRYLTALGGFKSYFGEQQKAFNLDYLGVSQSIRFICYSKKVGIDV